MDTTATTKSCPGEAASLRCLHDRPDPVGEGVAATRSAEAPHAGDRRGGALGKMCAGAWNRGGARPPDWTSISVAVVVRIHLRWDGHRARAPAERQTFRG
jgi:hypothetical protein